MIIIIFYYFYYSKFLLKIKKYTKYSSMYYDMINFYVLFLITCTFYKKIIAT